MARHPRRWEHEALGLSAVGLTYGVVTEFDDWEVVPHTPICPAHAQLRGDVPLDATGVVVEHGKPVPLLQWNAREAFANVPESIMKRLCEDYDVPPRDEVDADDIDYESALALDLMAVIDPEMSMESCMAALLDRPSKEDMHLTEDVDFDFTLDELLDTMTRDDAKVFKAHVEKVHASKKKASARVAAVRTFVPTTFRPPRS